MRQSAEPGALWARPMKFAPLLWAWLWRRPGRTLLGLTAIAIAFTLYGLALGEAEGFRRAAAARHVNIGQGFLLGAIAVSATGFGLILFLTANAMAQGVRLRLGEFAILKAIGFSHRLILSLVVTEAALPCLAGTALGLTAAPLLLGLLKLLLPPLAIFPGLVYTPAMLGIAALLALAIGGISGALPASRIIRLDVATALAGGLQPNAPLRAEQKIAPQESIAATPCAESRHHHVPKADLHLLRQIMVVTRVGLSTLRLRLKGAAVIVVGIGAVAFVLAAFLSMAEGIRSGVLDSGDPSRAIIRDANIYQAIWLGNSKLDPKAATVAVAAPGVARADDGQPLVDVESFHGLNLVKRNNGEKGNTTLVGVGPYWRQMTPSFRLLSGRLPRAGTRELIAGTLTARKFSELDSGFVSYHGQRWAVVGIYRVGDWWDGCLVGDAGMVKVDAKSTLDNAVRVRLSSPEAFADFRRYVVTRLPANMVVERETDYYADFWRDVPNNLYYVTYLLAGLIGAGAFAGTVQTMQSAVEEQAREIAILRALGFDGAAVAVSVVVESTLLATLGVFIAMALVWLWLDGFLYNGASGVFRDIVDLHLLLIAMGWGLVVALPGALGPALRLARQTPIEALREV